MKSLTEKAFEKKKKKEEQYNQEKSVKFISSGRDKLDEE